MTPRERRWLDDAIRAYCGPGDCLMFWTYLELCLDRKLTDVERREIKIHYLGYRPEAA